MISFGWKRRAVHRDEVEGNGYDGIGDVILRSLGE